MPVKAIPKVSIPRNGVSSFVRPCYKVSLQYCNWGGSSQGVRDFLTHPNKLVDRFAQNNKDVMFEILSKGGHPTFTFHYANGQKQAVDVRNLKVGDVARKLQEYMHRSGNEPFKFNHKVLSNNESVRGIWSPFHVAKNDRHRI
ncbi:hypothetical protein PUMCH_000112 [Australozyma saopauloensis]|uniref:Large ribosomal subunit protein mL43 n=1 Tax=Australozyma saopauloensis TaxID=291208 RepID=A0AAX4H2W7_9ASCO|nr:hypothetical protein PUMCH_000112 [[Candida] saopauloensis]